MITCQIVIAYIEDKKALMIDCQPDQTLATDVEKAIGSLYDMSFDVVRDYIFSQLKKGEGCEIKGDEVVRRVSEKMRGVMLADQLRKLGLE